MTIAATLRDATAQLRAAGCDSPRLDAVLLLAEALGWSPDRVRIDGDAALPAAAAAQFDTLLAARVARRPMSQILGRREFWSLDFRVTADVLDPRPDSETLVAGVLEQVTERTAKLRLLDFGTGSGCLLLALLHELPVASGLGIDRSAAALAVASDNAARLGLAARAGFQSGDWGAGLTETAGYDIVISNPPYIESAAIAGLAPEVAQHEPIGALDGGRDGLEAYRRLIPDAWRLLRPGGLLALEIGQGQEAGVATLLARAGFGIAVEKPDLGGIIRVLLAHKPV